MLYYRWVIVLFEKYRRFRPFTDDEAWAVFRLAAFAEAIGWTLLIIGIFLTNYVFHSRVPVILAGRTHGILFGLYLAAVLVLAPSLRWKWSKILLAGLMSIPPYGTLILEVLENQRRKQQNLKLLTRLIGYYRLILELRQAS